MESEKRRMHMNNVRLRNPYEIPLYIFSVLVNLLIIALILAGALLLGYVNALVGEPLSGPMVNVIVAAFVALLLLVPGLVLYRQLTRAGIRGSAVRLSRRQFPDIYAVKDDFARRLDLRRDPEIYLMSGNGVLNAFAARLSDMTSSLSTANCSATPTRRTRTRWRSSSGTNLVICGLGTRGCGTSYRPRTSIGFLCSEISSRGLANTPATGTERTWRHRARRDWCCSLPDDTSISKWIPKNC
jgi:hypothetical protein